MGKNLVVRLHVYLMCFLLAFSPAYTHALSGNPLNFTSVANGAKNAAGFVGDYFFKDYAGTTYSAKGHVVSNSQLAQVAKKRILCVTPVSGLVCAAMFAYGASQVADYLQSDGWTIDRDKQKIYKNEESTDFKYVINFTATSALVPQDSKSAACQVGGQAYATQQNRAFFSADVIGDPQRCLVKTTGIGGTITRDQTFSIVQVAVGTINEREITDTELEAAVAAQPLNVLTGLATSPDFAKEGHAPTATAAAAAKGEPASCPAGQTKVNGVCQAPPSENKCPAGQVFDTTTGKCKAATAAQCPVGQVYDVVQKKCVTPKLPEDEDDWPEFCEWAAPVCDFIEWAKQDVDKFDVSPVDVKDTAADAQSITSQILTLGYVSGGIKACPADYTFTFTVMGQGIDFDLSYKGLCDMLLMARPVVIAIAYFQAAKIVFIGRRD